MFYSVLTVALSFPGLILAVPTPTEDNIAVPLASCTNAPWKTGSCCEVVKEHVKGFDQDQWAYKCKLTFLQEQFQSQYR